MSELPGPMTPTKTTTIDTGRGGLYAEIFEPSGDPKGVAVVTHGYFEHCGRYRELAHVIANAGWIALTYDVRGHGLSPGARGFIERFEEYIDDYRRVLEAARKLAPSKPLVLIGHSHGSLITLRALSDERPPDAKAAIVSSPYLGMKAPVPSWKKVLGKVASRVAPALTQPNPLKAEDLTHDQTKIAERLADKMCFEVVPARWFTESNAAQEYVAAHADRIKIPTTWLVGGADTIADPATSKRVAARVSGAHYHDLVGLKHEVFNEVERGKVFAEVTKVLSSVS
ncbi:MAG TPA: lysophospholipase [Kofleriaceae bacterium]|jgi:alpha-beta hydrolase superfamily lysophospholipase|nr:lysophospholipase [Kofleriaceae bacterium]